MGGAIEAPLPLPALPEVSVAPLDAELDEGNEGTTTLFTFTVTRTGDDLAQDTEVDWTTTSGRDESADAAWVHAHLHRIEGDLTNAGYWYRRAGKPEHAGPLAAERAELAAALV